jgi:hypothetical protein
MDAATLGHQPEAVVTAWEQETVMTTERPASLERPLSGRTVCSPAKASSNEERPRVGDDVARTREQHEKGVKLAASIEQRVGVPSKENLVAYMEWVQRQDPAFVAPIIEKCYLLDHAEPPLHVTVRVVVLPPTLTLSNGKRQRVPVCKCQDPGCSYCQSSGGYRFEWQGPWTRGTC